MRAVLGPEGIQAVNETDGGIIEIKAKKINFNGKNINFNAQKSLSIKTDGSITMKEKRKVYRYF